MIPIVSVCDVFIAAVSFAIAAHLYESSMKQGSSNVFSFSLFYFFLGLFFFIEGAPLLSTNPNLIAAADILAYFMLSIALAQMAYVALLLSKLSRAADIAYYVALLFGIFFVFIRVEQFAPSVSEVNGLFIYWHAVFAPWLRVFTGVITTLVGLVTVVTFAVQGLQHRNDTLVWKRSVWIAGGMFVASISSVIALILSPTGSFSKVLIATVLAIIGLLIVLRGVTYHQMTDDSRITRQ